MRLSGKVLEGSFGWFKILLFEVGSTIGSQLGMAGDLKRDKDTTYPSTAILNCILAPDELVWKIKNTLPLSTMFLLLIFITSDAKGGTKDLL